jgi:pimeloyl-ACP methyl ester carboxylesterase
VHSGRIGVVLRLRVPAVLLAAALVAGCSGAGGAGDGAAARDAGDGEAAAATEPAPAEPFTGAGDFYAVPDPLPAGEHGTLLRYEKLTDVDLDGATAYRIMYLSESVAGDPIAVTGTALVPAGAAPADGRRILTIAHGTTGIADECAPSKNPRTTELALMAPYLDQGYLVAETDYEGLGTPGRHPYLVGESEGRGVLDATVAARQLPDADAGDQFAIFGYSQGGHGALWAGQLADDWTPGLHLVGTVAGAPATEIPVILAAGRNLPIVGFLYMIIAGFNQAYPDAPLDQVLTPAGESDLAAVDTGCGGEVIRHFAGTSSDLLQPDAGQTGEWATLAEENNPGNVATDHPILIVHSAADDVVPAALSGALFDRMCGLGQTVERRLYEKGQGHGAAVGDAVHDGFDWIQARFAGEPALSTCPAAG